MITDNELQAVKFSATKKEFYQIWNELLETAKKLSDRWDPTTTNESDPGIVLLKVAAGLADKLFYNIDVNTLSAFMPSASETTAMRKLCEMMGYNVKYYTSATTDVTLSFVGSTETMDQFTDGIYIPRFSVVKDESDEIAYVLLEDAYLNGVNSNKVRTAIEGEVCICESENDDIITLAHLDDNFRYYLPETQIAENGIFIKSVESTSFDWTQVDNLNTQISGTKVFKFGYDSNKELPYIQFPDDVSAIMEDGLYIYYIRTNGRNGNVSARKLSKLERPAIWDDAEFAGDLSEAYRALSIDDFRVVNAAASTNGADIESIDEAYNNYKKIIGTFDTLVTCRDYMNKIYTMTVDENNTTPLVSNVIVSDIRDDINRAVTLCSFNEYGICYLDKPLTTTVERTITTTSGSSATFNETVDKISCFDLILYPFKTVYGLGTQDEFKNSFEYTDVSANDIKLQLEESKVVSHNIITPTETVTKYDKTVTMGNEIACIKNYLKLKANIKTTYKVNSTEQAAILNNIYTAIYNNFNMRKIDFGEEIPFDTILSVIENADTRIKKVSLDDPDVYSKVAFVDGTESFLAVSASSTDAASTNGKIAHNKLVRRNILAGRVSMFNYDTDFATSYDEQTYVKDTTHYGTYPDDDTKYIKELKSECQIGTEGNEASNVKLQANEVIQFRAPNFITSITYPAYVNYYLVKSGTSSTNVAAVMKTFKDVVSGWDDAYCQNLIKNNSTHEKVITGITSPAIFNANLEVYGLIFSKTGTGSGTSYTRLIAPVGTSSTTEYYVLPLNSETFGIWHNALLTTVSSTTTVDYGMYKCLGADLTKVPGKLVDSSHNVYVKCTSHYAGASLKPFISYYIPDYTTGAGTNYGIGITGTGQVIKANTEYQLGDNEHLYINYTPSTTDSEGNSTTGTVQNIEYGKGDIIRPNVDLVDSSDYHSQGHSYTKTDGYNSSWGIDGMFAFGADEQVEIRKKAEVDLDVTDANGNKISGNIYVYWELNNEPDTGLEHNKSRSNKTKFKFYEADGSEAESSDGSYTLKEGEYFYYTDKNKTDLVYYGPGTEIVRTGSMELLKSTTQTFSSEDVINYGMAAGVPWVTIAVDANNYITAKEYQYINLAEGDTLTKLNGQITFIIGSTYNTVGTTGSTEYIIGGEAGVLPTISVTDAEWKVHSLLEFNLGPTTVQTLRNSNNVIDKITIVYAPKTNTTIPNPKVLQSSASDNLMSLKANYVCQAAYSPKDTTITLYDEDGNVESTPNDFKVRVFKQVEVTAAGSATTALNLHDYGEHWTLLEFGNQTSETAAFTKINTYVPAGEFGLIMIQYNNLTNETDTTKRAYLKLGSDSSGQSLGIYNNTTANTWWNGMTSNNKYYLHDGINIVYVKPEVKSIEIHADANKKHTAVLGDLTLVKGIAQDRLSYYNIEASSATVQLQADINYDDPDHAFYYNCPIDNSIAIELNTSLGETMADPKVLYDYNNVNNKFVISEIDYSTLKSGITITRDSRL